MNVLTQNIKNNDKMTLLDPKDDGAGGQPC